MKKIIITTLAIFIANFSFANTHTIYVDQNGNDYASGTFSEPVATVKKAVENAIFLNPTEEIPVLIKLGQGEFYAPEENWTIDFQWIFFAGNGPENTKLIANKIKLSNLPKTDLSTKNTFPITGFKDIYISAYFNINDNFLPVNNVKVLQLEKNNGQLEGIWYNAVGELQTKPC